MNANSLGAYGFRVTFSDPSEPLDDLVVLDQAATEVVVSWRNASATADIEEVDENRVVYGTRGATTFRIDRDPPSIHLDLSFPPFLGALVHPLLTVGISVHARWRGDVTLHAGAFETPEGAWGVMGDRRAGKSALLAALAARGRPVVSDDLLAIQDGAVWAGPDCVDLRPDTADRFGARYLGVVGGRPRFRLSTPHSSVRPPIHGFFILDWHDRPKIAIESLPMRERLEWLYRQEYIRLVGHPDPAKLVPLVPLPAWRLTRPRDWAATDDTVARVLEVVEEASSVTPRATRVEETSPSAEESP